MNKKERALAAIRHMSVDKIPSAYRGTNNLSIRLNKYFDFKNPEDILGNYKNLINALGADFYASGSKICKFTTYTARYVGPDPQKPYVKDHSFYYQIGANSKSGTAGSGESRLDYDVIVDPPLGSINDASEIKDGFLTKRLAYFDFSYFDNKYGRKDLTHEKVSGSNEDFICLGNLTCFFMMCWALRGQEKFLMDLAFNKKLAEKLINEVCEFGIEYNRRELEAFGNVGQYYGAVDDVAGQYGMIIAPGLFEKYFLPAYKKLISNIKKCGIIFSWHCCGSVHKVLPMMIEAGIDVFDVVQTSARDMEIENVYRLYGKDVCLHGGVDVQNLLVFKTPKEIREEVKKIKALWGNDGGIIVAPSHETLPETPIENVIAMYEELNS